MSDLGIEHELHHHGEDLCLLQDLWMRGMQKLVLTNQEELEQHMSGSRVKRPSRSTVECVASYHDEVATKQNEIAKTQKQTKMKCI